MGRTSIYGPGLNGPSLALGIHDLLRLFRKVNSRNLSTLLPPPGRVRFEESRRKNRPRFRSPCPRLLANLK